MKLFPWALFRRLVLAQWLLVLATLLAAGLGGRALFERTLIAQSRTQQESALAALANYFNPAPDWCARAARGTRVRLTLIAADGKVLCDTESDPLRMDNHSDRPEVSTARQAGVGHSFRRSDTLDEEMLYSALRVTGDSGSWIIRSALHLSELGPMLRVFDRSLIVFLALSAAVFAVLSLFSARTLVLPMADLLRKFRQEGPHTGDWNELEDSINSMSRELNLRVQELLTERAQQSTVLAAISDGIIAVDLRGKPLFFNSRFELYFGRGLNLRETDVWKLFRTPELVAAFRSAMSSGESGTLTFSSETQAEGKRSFSVSVAPLASGTPAQTYGAVGVFHDITEITQAEQLRIDFVANVSHELRTPLTAIKGYTETLISDSREGRAPDPEFLEVIRRNSERLMALIQDLLDISALESSAILQRTTVATRPLCGKVVETLLPGFQARNQTCTWDATAESVYADPGRLEQVLTNLLENASKYSGRGSNIHVEWQPWNADSSRGVVLKVRDSGPGIAPEHLPRLFERFYRVDKARSREQGGTGLGLAIVKHILLRHGGKVWVESPPGKDTVFYCYFPGPN